MRTFPLGVGLGDLWGAAARRGVRKARRVLGLGKQRLDPLPAEVGPRFLIERRRLLPAARALVELHPARAAETLARARDILAGSVELFGRAVRVPEGAAWHKDPLSGAAWPTGAVGTDELLRPGRDARTAWELGRLGHLVTLGRARCLAELGGASAAPDLGPACARAVAAGIEEFARANPVGQGVHWATAMEAALRLVNIGLAFHLVRGHAALPAGFERRMVILAAEHGAFIADNLEDGSICPNNHLAADYLGLLAAGALLGGCALGAEYRKLGAQGLGREIGRQVRADGGSFEASLPYHRLAAEIFFAGAVIGARTGAPLPPEYCSQGVQPMLRFARRVAWPDGTAPQIGDDDASRAVPLADRGPLDLAWLGSLGAVMFDMPELAPPGPPAEEALWIFGAPAARQEWPESAAPRPPCGPEVLPHSGLCVLRGGPAQAVFRFGDPGQRGRGGHAHNDKLSVQLFLNGRIAIADPGTFTYAADPDARNAFRSTRAHATVCVGGTEQAPFLPGRLWALPGPSATLLLAHQKEGSQIAGANLHVEGRLPYTHRREVVLAESGALLVSDRVTGPGARQVEARFPLCDEQVNLRAATLAEAELLSRLDPTWGSDWHTACVAALGPPDEPFAILAVAPPAASWRLDLPPAAYSPGYGRAAAARSVRLWACGPLPLAFRSVVVPLEE